MFRRSKSKTPAFDKDTYESVVARAGSLGITEQERKAILKAIDKAIEDKKKQLKPEEMSNKAFKALQDTLSDYADVIGDAASQKATDIIEGRIPADLSTPIGPVKDFGLILTQIELAAEEITQNVIDFHNHLVIDEFDKAMVLLGDITNTEESTILLDNFFKLREVYGKGNKQIKALRKQITALENTNKAFAKQYSRLDFSVLEVWWHLRDLAKAFAEQDKALKEEIAKRTTGAPELDINLATDSSIADSVIQEYEDAIKNLSSHLDDALAKKVFKDALPELSTEILDNIDFDKIAAEEAQKAYSTIGGEISDAVKKEAEEKFKELCATRAGSLYRLVRDSPGAAAKVIATNFMAGVERLGTSLTEGLIGPLAAGELPADASDMVEIEEAEALIQAALEEPEAESEGADAQSRIFEVVREIDNVDAKIKQTAAALATLNKSKGARSDSQSYRQKKKNLKNELASLKAAKDKFEEEKERLVGESGSTVLLRIPEDWAFEDEDEDEVEVDFGDLY
jgi:hypothetical protein